MIVGLVLLSVLAPLALAALVAVRPAPGWWLAPAAAVPATVLALVAPAGQVELELPWLLVGARLGLDPFAAPFLLPAALLWLAAALHASGYLRTDPRRAAFAGYFLLAMAGNLGFILARDVVTAYAAYTAMSLATYGLVAHAGTPDARRAARIYIVMAVASEMLLLAGAALAVGASAGATDFARLPAAIAASPLRDVIWTCLIAGFAVKVGVLGVHVWLPLAHSIAPTPASAVLSGAMVKLGLLGWLRLAPGAPHGDLLVALGLAAALYGVLVGITQHRPKAILAYSTVSQMGLATVAIGIGLTAPEGLPAVSGPLALFVVHHGLVKGALFLGVGLISSGRARATTPYLAAVLGLLALALIGAPLTTGALAKVGLKGVAGGWVAHAISVSSIGTTLLMARLLRVTWPLAPGGAHRASGVEWIAWAALSALALGVPWSVAPSWVVDKALSWAGVAAASWPLAIGLVLGFAIVRDNGRALPHVPTGDLIIPIDRRASALTSALARRARVPRARWRWRYRTRATWLTGAPAGIERALERWRTIVLVFLLLVGVVAALLLGPSGGRP